MSSAFSPLGSPPALRQESIVQLFCSPASRSEPEVESEKAGAALRWLDSAGEALAVANFTCSGNLSRTLKTMERHSFINLLRRERGQVPPESHHGTLTALDRGRNPSTPLAMQNADVDRFIAQWKETGGSELANTQSFVNGLCGLLRTEPPNGSRTDDKLNNYVFERSVFQQNGDGTESFGRIDAYKLDCFVLEAKQGSDKDRADATSGDLSLDLFGQTAAARVKRGTAKRGTPGWTKAMLQARGQAERYAKALPVDHGWPPFLMVADIGYCIEVYADFTRTGKAYVQFPDRASFRIMLDDLGDPKVRERLRAIWQDPMSLNSAEAAATATSNIAKLLAVLARRLEARRHSPEQVAGFLMRLLFTMFAQGTKLIPEKSFTDLLVKMRPHPEHLHHQLTALWKAMDEGGFAPALGQPVLRFNGYLFKEQEALPLELAELDVVIDAAKADWTQVEPAIFGTLLERALDPKERSRLGAHYTPRDYVDRLVFPTIIEPLRADWNGVKAAAGQLLEKGETEKARREVERFHTRLAQSKVLDPACGTGNFLYVALARMKEVEGEVVELLTQLGDDQYVAELSGHTITPENFLGIEVNPRAAAIAQLVLWIGYLQWHFRVTGKGRMPPEPILRDIRTIENRDALITWDNQIQLTDDDGEPLTRWDGNTMRIHPVTKKDVPDESARVPVYRFVRPRRSKWPKADFIVGNPPFIGKQKARLRLGDAYIDALRTVADIPDSADFVMYWWDTAAHLVGREAAQRFGFVTTNSISQVFNRRIVERHLAGKDAISLVFAIPNAPWVDEADGADVRVAMTVGVKRKLIGRVEDAAAGWKPAGDVEQLGKIGSDLRVGVSASTAKPLKANRDLCAVGYQLNGKGFIISAERKADWQGNGPPSPVIFPLRNGRDLAHRARDLFVIDLHGYTESQAEDLFQPEYQHLLNTVKPEREQNREESRRANWWLYGRSNETLRKAIAGLKRVIAGAVTSKHRFFTFVDADTHVDSSGFVIGMNDGYALGVLASRIHCVWALSAGTRMGVGDDPRYNKTTCFEAFPFPRDVPVMAREHIRAEAEALDGLRKRVLDKHADLTLTSLYNVMEALRAGRALTDPEREIHDRGLVTLIRQHHDRIDVAVAQAFDWAADLSDEEIVAHVVALNKARLAEEEKGVVRWLRPELQAPDNAEPVAATLNLGEAVPPIPSGAGLRWPTTLPEQVTAVAQILAAAATPISSRDVARAFVSKRAASIEPVLEALAAIGQARRLGDGRYAA